MNIKVKLGASLDEQHRPVRTLFLVLSQEQWDRYHALVPVGTPDETVVEHEGERVVCKMVLDDGGYDDIPDFPLDAGVEEEIIS